MKHLPLVALALTLVGIVWQGGAAYAELRGEVRAVREHAQIEMSHTQSWIDDLRARLRAVESK